jgi:hypothetical protein
MRVRQFNFALQNCGTVTARSLHGIFKTSQIYDFFVGNDAHGVPPCDSMELYRTCVYVGNASLGVPYKEYTIHGTDFLPFHNYKGDYFYVKTCYYSNYH